MTSGKSQYFYLRLASIPVIVILIYLLLYLFNPYTNGWDYFTGQHTRDLAIEIGLNLLLGWAIVETSNGIARGLEYYFPWSGSALPRFLLQTLLIIMSVGFLLFLQNLAFEGIYGDLPFTPQEQLNLWQFFMVTILVSVLVSTVHTGYFLLERWKTSMSEAAELKVKTMEFKEIAMQAELQALKLQLDPHFMFNNFSTLSELINENPDTATRFLENLSRVYRYMIQNLKRDLVQLKDEIAFVKAYTYLMHIRHGDHVQVSIDLDSSLLKKAIPPITIQPQLENAIKHNKATSAKPLRIRIFSPDGQSVEVANNVQPLENALPSTNIGLQNIRDRYRLMSGRMPEIVKTPGEFRVILPLIDF